ncbi:MAG: chromosome segregation protein SMC [Ignavibacteria bacterium]|nr:chromosome segregation protein SMC [Ignavibacteria bacterium]
MYLSQLEIFGFKSFAQKVRLRFDDGITAIVGPNGCGKTNIVDAIRWTLGEQRTSTLRSSKMEDVIFNGTKSRKPLGFTEASLTIENTKGILPSDYSEVTITRRMYRSGESEYLLNKSLCRLKDILNLFMDTGMGANAYSVIELKMVETILSDRTDERRRLFEEAAGVTKYKHSRKIASRKLEDVQNDLLRVNDIIKEVQSTVNSLHRQAKKAERFHELKTLLQQFERNFLELEFNTALYELSPLELQLERVRSEKITIDASLQTEEQNIDAILQSSRSLEHNLASVSNNVQRIRDELHSLEERKVLATERSSSLEQNILRFQNEQQSLEVQKRQSEEKSTSLDEQQSILEMKLLKAKEFSESVSMELKHIEREEIAAKQILQSANDSLFDALRTTTTKQTELEKFNTQMRAAEQHQERLEKHIEQYSQKVASLNDLYKELTTRAHELRFKFSEAEHSFFEKENIRAGVQKELEQLQRNVIDTEHAIHQRQSRIDFLKGLVERNEGLSEGAKFLLSHEQWKTQLMPLAELIRTSDEYRVAVDTVMGDAREFLVAKTESDVERAIEILWNEHKGKVTFVCLDKIQPFHPTFAGESRNILNNIECDETIRSVVALLLGDVFVVNDILEAKELFEEFPTIRCVSKDGQLITQNGFRRGGSLRQEEGVLIGKQSQIDALQNEVVKFLQEKNELQRLLGMKEQNVASFDMKAMHDEVKEIERELAQTETRIAQVAFEKKHAEDARENTISERERLRVDIQRLEETIWKLQRELEILEEHKTEKEASVIEARHFLSQREHERQRHAEKTQHANISLVELEGERKNMLLEMKHCKQTIAEAVVLLQRAAQEMHAAKKEVQTQAKEMQNVADEWERTHLRFVAAEQEKSVLEVEYHRTRKILEERESSVKEQRRLHEYSLSSVHELELAIAEKKLHIEHLKERARNELSVELAIKTFSEEEPSVEILREEIQKANEKLTSLGSVNFEAFEQYGVEKERHDFLMKQRDDLLASEKTLKETIQEINATAQEKFLSTFTKIRENFISIFKTLFDEGDESDLHLEENTDVLECGIAIVAKPRGKRPTSVDLLSGGEKTLTAIALLFAIYLVKPSPFCILDEVDAPLDDLNIDRFTRLLKKFSDNTQFIVVTHNKRTMEAANTLYGVTMEEDGISKIVAVKFQSENTVESATLATEE